MCRFRHHPLVQFNTLVAQRQVLARALCQAIACRRSSQQHGRPSGSHCRSSPVQTSRRGVRRPVRTRMARRSTPGHHWERDRAAGTDTADILFLMDSGPDITELLAAWTGGNRAALDALMPSVIDELKRIAGRYLANEPHARTLQTTALVNE